MQRTTLYEKNGKVYLQREFQIGEDRWQPVTRFAFRCATDAIMRYPIYFPSEISLSTQEQADACRLSAETP